MASADAAQEGGKMGEPDDANVAVSQTMEFAWRSADDESDFNALLGRRVRLHGLCARPELNGRVGRVWSWHEEAGRAGVKLEGAGGVEEDGTLAVRPANLAVLASQRSPAAGCDDDAADAAEAEPRPEAAARTPTSE